MRHNYGLSFYLGIFFLVSFSINSNSQCPGMYDRVGIYQIEIPNEPDYWFYDDTRISKSNDGRFIVKADTVAHLNYFYPGVLSHKNFEVYFEDSADFQKTFIKNITTGESFYLGFEERQYSNELKNCFVYFCNRGKGRRRVSVFDFNKSTVTSYKIASLKAIGYNDTCVFIQPYDFKLEGIKYRGGTIISLNENGIKIIDAVLKTKSDYFYDYKQVFYSNSYKVNIIRSRTVEVDCGHQYYSLIQVNYLNSFVDSFEIESCSWNPIPQVIMNGDTLVCTSYNATGIVYKKYFKTTVLFEWKETDWKKMLAPYSRNDISIYNRGNLIFIRTKSDSSKKQGLVLKDEKYFTLNDIPLKKEATYYTLVFAFDMKKNEFVGYPKLEF